MAMKSSNIYYLLKRHTRIFGDLSKIIKKYKLKYTIRYYEFDTYDQIQYWAFSNKGVTSIKANVKDNTLEWANKTYDELLRDLKLTRE